MSSELFSKKGFHNTSMQEIADAIGVVKGTLYVYFRSKDELLIAIIEHYYDLLNKKLERIASKKGMAGKERFNEFLYTQINGFIEHQDFIMMQMKDRTVQRNREVALQFENQHKRMMNFYGSLLLDWHGETIEPYIHDLTIMLQSMLSEFLMILAPKKEVNSEVLATFLTDRMESIIQDLLLKRPNPLVTNERGFYFD